MAQKQSDARTDALSADMKTLQERFDKLSDKLNDTQREVVQLRAELSGQGKRIDDYQVYVGYVGIWLAVFSVIVAMVSVVSYIQAAKRATDEARRWIEVNERKLLDDLQVLEGRVIRMKFIIDKLDAASSNFIKKIGS